MCIIWIFFFFIVVTMFKDSKRNIEEEKEGISDVTIANEEIIDKTKNKDKQISNDINSRNTIEIQINNDTDQLDTEYKVNYPESLLQNPSERNKSQLLKQDIKDIIHEQTSITSILNVSFCILICVLLIIRVNIFK